MRNSIKVLKHEFVGKLFEHGICNGTIGVITKVIDDDDVEINSNMSQGANSHCRMHLP